jgi:hypothetical protein
MFIDPKARLLPNGADADRLALSFSDRFGLCVRATKPVAPGDVLDRFTGLIGADVSQHSLQVEPGRHISETRFIGFLSHGCDPNCRLDMARFELVALRGIASGDILTIDYAQTEDVLHAQFACGCGADACRRWIVGRNEQPPIIRAVMR